jgi:hypothetical protein
MGVACSTCGRNEKHIQHFFVGTENLKIRDHSEDVRADGGIILEWILEK